MKKDEKRRQEEALAAILRALWAARGGNRGNMKKDEERQEEALAVLAKLHPVGMYFLGNDGKNTTRAATGSTSTLLGLLAVGVVQLWVMLPEECQEAYENGLDDFALEFGKLIKEAKNNYDKAEEKKA